MTAREWAEAVMGICNIENDVGQLDYITSRFELAMAQARAEGDDAKRLADALEVVEQRAARVVAQLRRDPAEAERLRLSRVLGQAANEMFNGHAPVYPSNLLDVISAWLAGWKIEGGHKPTEDQFLAAVERAEAVLAKRKGPTP
jgi:hypothetical protein